MDTIDDLLSRHPFFKGLKPEYLALIAGCGQNVHFDAGAYLLREGDTADRFFAIRGGSVAVETYMPSRGPVRSRRQGEIWLSWLFPLRLPVRCLCARGRSRHGVRRRVPADRATPIGAWLRAHETPGRSCPVGWQPPGANSDVMAQRPLAGHFRAFRVIRVRRELSDVWTLDLQAADGEGPVRFLPGQFTMVYVFGIGEVPLSISGDPAKPDVLVHTVRAVAR
jgi:hypothetical protein